MTDNDAANRDGGGFAEASGARFDHLSLASACVERFQSRTARIGVIGLGYVGLPLIHAMSKANFRTVGFDIDPVKVAMLNRGESYIQHLPDTLIAELRAGDRFCATTDFSQLKTVDAIVICVPTPLTKQREPDLSYIEKSARAIAPHLRPGHLVVLESTTWPGTTREVVKPILEKTGLKSGRDFFLAFSPEREDPGNAHFSTTVIPKVVGGEGEDALLVADTFYAQFVAKTVPVRSTAVAEAVKLTENIFRSVNIALVNELKVVYAAMGIDVWDVIEAAKTKPFGYMPFYPGPGLGGHCIPIDPFYLTWKAREYGLTTRFIELAGEVNTAIPHYVVAQLAEALDQKFRKGLNGSRILMLGVAYKKNIDDSRESPAYKLMELLEARGAVVAYHDPHVPEVPHTREHPEFGGRKSVEPVAAAAASDVVLIVTDHDAVDYAAIVDAAALVIDTRNVCAKAGIDSDKVVKA